jgi:hypothetical protein
MLFVTVSTKFNYITKVESVFVLQIINHRLTHHFTYNFTDSVHYARTILLLQIDRQTAHFSSSRLFTALSKVKYLK